jgi:hypothetical protein
LPRQLALVERLLEHWSHGHGGRANPCRQEALQGVRVVASLEAAAQDLKTREGAAPEVVATSARGGDGRVRFDEARTRIASTSGPVLLVFGTGWGLAPAAVEFCDWTLEPIRGPGTYNHLSVRSAASIVVDRLFGNSKGGPGRPGIEG